MIKNLSKFTGLTASVVALAATASAEVKINDYLSLDGYAIAAGTVTDPDAGKKNYTLADSGSNNFDSARIALIGKYNEFSGKASLFYVPGRTGSEAGVLDAYATYTAGPVSVTGGKFLSYLGYEAFEAVNMAQLTWGFASGIPGYATGAKVDYVGDGFTLGVSAQDSLMMDSNTFYQGDGDFDDGLGYTFAATYTGIEKLTVFVGGAIDDEDGITTGEYVFDFWASYKLTDKLTVAGEVSYYDDISTSYLAFAQYSFTDKFSTVFRWSAQETDATSELATMLTVAPAYAFTSNFILRGEVSYLDAAKTNFYGVQGVFKF